MGIEHVKRIEELLKGLPTESFARSYFTNELGMNYSVVLKALAYLEGEGKIIKITEGKTENYEKYQWRKQ